MGIWLKKVYGWERLYSMVGVVKYIYTMLFMVSHRARIGESNQRKDNR